jgi:hypothetical protein
MNEAFGSSGPFSVKKKIMNPLPLHGSLSMIAHI